MSISGRRIVIFVFLALGFLSLVWRIIDLHILERHFLLKQSEARIKRVVDIPAHRGIISDRNGKPLAISAQVYSVWFNPKVFHSDDKNLSTLSSLLQISKNKLAAKVKHSVGKSFVYLKRTLPPTVAQKIKDAKIDGVFLQQEYKRFYPEGEVTAHVVGFTNIDDRGQEGLELAYDNWLRGVPGKKVVIKDRVGNIVAELHSIKEPQEGHDLALTIDSRIQYLAYQALQEAVAEFHAESGSVVVVDTTNGEILAMVNWPTFNPNNIVHANDGRLRNRALTDQFEPGSTMKAFSIASFLQSGKFTPDTVLNTAPGWININGNIIHDHRNYGKITVEEVMKRSSNVGMSKMALKSSPESLWGLLHQFGFGERTFSGYPGEANGSLIVHPHWRPIDVATMAIGYGMAVTPLQLAQGYAVIANEGIKNPVHFVKADQKIESVKVLDKKTAKTVLSMLESVVTKTGTGSRAKIRNYRVAGKTGTAYIAGQHGYDKKHYHSSFVGIAPASSPRLVVAVVIKNPQHQHFGAIVAAPAFAKVMAGALRLLAIAPDNLPTTASLR